MSPKDYKISDFKINWAFLNGFLRKFSESHPEVKFEDAGLDKDNLPSWKIISNLKYEKLVDLLTEGSVLTIFGIHFQEDDFYTLHIYMPLEG